MIGDDMILLFCGPVVEQMLIGTSGRVLVGNGKPMITNHLPRRYRSEAS
jgi:hypothetical protein